MFYKLFQILFMIQYFHCKEICMIYPVTHDNYRIGIYKANHNVKSK
jgi:hypothetical protein